MNILKLKKNQNYIIMIKYKIYLYLLLTFLNYIYCNKISLKKEKIKTTSLCNKGNIVNLCSETTTTQKSFPSNFYIPIEK